MLRSVSLRTLFCLTFLSSLWYSSSVALAEETPAAAGVSYWKDVRPIFQAQCQGCHQPAKARGEYIMTNYAAMLAGGESGDAAIVPHDPDASYLLSLIAVSDGTAEMPKDADPLSESQIQTIRQWIEQGAIDDTPASSQQQFDQDHPPVYAAKPVITAIAFSGDGKTLAVSGYHEVVLHDVDKLLSQADSLTGRLIGMSERIESAAFSPDSKRLAIAGGSPGRLGEVQIWNVADRSLELARSLSYDTCYGASWSPDGTLVAFGCPDNSVRAIKAATGEQVLFNGAHNDWVLDTVFAVDGKHVVSVSRDRSMKLIEVETERFIDNITSITPGALKGGLHAVDRHPTKNELLIGGADGVPKVYRMFREQDRKIGDDFNLIKAYPEIPGRIFDTSFSNDGTLIVAGSSINGAGNVFVYKTEDGSKLAEMQDISGAIYTCAFSPDGRYVASGGFDGDVFLHESATGKLVRRFTPVVIKTTDVAQK